MERNARVILVTTFVLLTGLAIFLFGRWINAPDEEDSFEQRLIEFNGSVSGLSVGSEVRYLGVSVGRVLSIELSEDHLGRVDVTMGTDQRLPQSSKLIAILEPLGITGLSLIELQNRPDDMESFTTESDIIPGYPSVVSQISGSAGRIATSIENALNQIATVVDEESIAELDEILRQTRRLTENLAQASSNFEDLIESTGRIGSELEQTLPEFRAAARRLDQEVLPAITAAGESLSAVSESAAGTIEDNRAELQLLVERELPTLVGVTDDLAETLQEMNRLMGNINGEPGALLFGEQVQEVEIDRD